MTAKKTLKEKPAKKKVAKSKKISAKEKITLKEFEKKVLELAKTGLTSEKIGEKLKQEGIHSNDFDKKISQILKKENEYANPDLKNIEEKLKRIDSHYARNRQDKKTLKSRERVSAKLRKLKNYFKVKEK